jgi:hypothetical protein
MTVKHMTTRQWDEFDSLRQYLVQALASACKAEGPRDLDGELQAVWREAHVWAAIHPGTHTITFDDVLDCDRRAMGHVDWARKLPLYVAEKVYGY